MGILCSASCCLVQPVCIPFPGQCVQRQHSSFWSESRLPNHLPSFLPLPTLDFSFCLCWYFFSFPLPSPSDGWRRRRQPLVKLPFLNILAPSGTFLFHIIVLPDISDLQGDTEYKCRCECFSSPRRHMVRNFCLLFASI